MPAHIAKLEKLVRDSHIGGVIFFQGGPVRQARMTNRLQDVAKLPLMVGIDGEWGLQMRLKDSTIAFPRQMTLGAHPDEKLVERMGGEIARQCRRMGIHVNFAPVVDINSNPANPVIGMRSFGENKENVALKGIAYMKGMQHLGVLACAKHFPGHGDTDADSHTSLPTVKRTKPQILETELYPFRRLIADSLGSVMVAHLNIPALDKTGKPSTLSKAITTDLLRKQMGFDGLAFTDALNMKGAANAAPPGQLEVMALDAGNDVLLFSEDVEKGVASIKAALKSKKIKEKDLDVHVRRILMAKYWCGLAVKPAPIQEVGLFQDLNSQKTKALINECFRASITVVKNERKLVPFRNLDTMDFASVSIGVDGQTAFTQTLDKYAPFRHFQSKGDAADLLAIEQKLDTRTDKLKKSVVVVALHTITGKASQNYGISVAASAWLAKIAKTSKLVIVAFGNPYSLKALQGFSTLVCAYEDTDPARSGAAQALFGAGATGGRLPISLAMNLPEGQGQFEPDAKRLGFGLPEEAGLDSRYLARMDTIVEDILNRKLTPGCQIVVARHGKVVFQKAYGHMSYKPLDSISTAPDTVNNETMYDIASVTKVAGTLQAVMFLYERGALDVTKPLVTYMPELEGTNKANLIIADILAHQSGLVPFIPYWKRTVGSAVVSEIYYCDQPDDNWFRNQVTPGVFAMKTIDDSLWKWTVDSPLLPKNSRGTWDYKYSDLSFHVMKRICERLLNQPIDEFVDQNFYRPLGLRTMCYKPLERFMPERIAPTEDDHYYRHRMLRGTVHDQGAAMVGGVAGHAGIFSNALDLAILMQMNMQRGDYGGQRYFQDATMDFFTAAHFPRNRRGLGWDKPMPHKQDGPTAKSAGMATFGHTGFTGTCTWADPEQELVFVFLSNRVHPNADDNRLINENVRPRLHEVVYRAMTDTLHY
jgi:beta-glucosidase-like glycosyl hydrolase/CubicO group peptidase (beta-lactamase class C family)